MRRATLRLLPHAKRGRSGAAPPVAAPATAHLVPPPPPHWVAWQQYGLWLVGPLAGRTAHAGATGSAAPQGAQGAQPPCAARTGSATAPHTTLRQLRHTEHELAAALAAAGLSHSAVLAVTSWSASGGGGNALALLERTAVLQDLFGDDTADRMLMQ